MDMKTRKLHQGLAYSDVEKAGLAFEKVRAKYPPLHEKVSEAMLPFKQKLAEFDSITAPGEGAKRFMMNRQKRIQQTGRFYKRGF